MLEKLIEKELERANAKHKPYFPTIEHTLTVLREEVEESSEEIGNIEACFNKIWKDYRGENINEKYFDRLEMHANNLLEECVQIIAMVRKYKYSKENMDCDIKKINGLEE
jgi:hypothetical protein